MSCVAITRGGWGSIYSFKNKAEANNHPLVQYGDAVLDGPESVTTQYNVLEIGRLLAMLGCEKLRLSVLRSIHPDLGLKHSDRVKRIAERASEIWGLIEQAAAQPPSDPNLIFQLVADDRKAMSKESTMEDANKKAATTEANAKAAKPAKEPKAPKPPKYGDNDVIKLMSDAEGKQYGKDHNPKRTGSASAIRFANYTDGMTVAELLKMGDTQAKVFGDLDYDQAKGYIEIEKAV